MKTTTHTLKNGLRVLLIDTESFPTVTALVMVGAGSRYERKDNNGIAHFLEHMFYKGSKHYPNPEIISQIIEGMGGHWNAFTSKDYTGYYIKASTDHYKTMTDILSDLLLNSLFERNEIEKEKGVIVEEINMYEDTPQRRISELIENIMFGDSPLGYDIAGTKETVTSFTRETFVHYMNSLYKPNNAVVVFAGGLGNTEKYLSYVEQKFGEWKNGDFTSFSHFDSTQNAPRVQVFHKNTEQAHFCLGFPTFSQSDSRRAVLKVLSTVLGGGASSRLFQEVREKRGLCYYIGTGLEQYQDIGNIVTQSGVAKDISKVKNALQATLVEHIRITEGKILETDIERSKEMIKGRLLLSMEDSFNVAHYHGLKLLHEGEIETPESVIKKVEKVTKSQVVALAKEIFVSRKMNFAIIGPFEKNDFTEENLLSSFSR